MRMLHLLRHDVRQHWRLLLAWTLFIIAQPIVAVLFRGEPGKPAAIDGVIPALLVIGARLLVGAVLVMTVVQQDAPLDNRTFWRTRPIAPATMAAAKLLLVALALLGLPLLVTLGVAIVAEVPLWYWPTIAIQVLLIDGALLGLTLVCAAFTRHLSTALVVAILTLLLGLSVYSYASRAGVALHTPMPMTAMYVDPTYAAPTLLLVLVVALWTMAVALWWGVRGRSRALAVAAAASVALVVVWYVPAARLHRRPPLADKVMPALTLDPQSVRALSLPDTPQRIAIVADVRVAGEEVETIKDLWLVEGTLDDGRAARHARASNEPNTGYAPGQPVAAMLAVLSPEEFHDLRGRRVHFRGRFTANVRRGARLAAGPLSPATRLATPIGHYRATRVTPASRDVAAGELVLLRPLTTSRGYPEFVLRDARSGRRLDAVFWWPARTSFSYLLLLPTLARPFEWDPVHLRFAQPSASTVDPERTSVELHELEPSWHATPAADLAFVMPDEFTPQAKGLRWRP